MGSLYHTSVPEVFVPVGAIVARPPTGFASEDWLLCNGIELPTDDYDELYEVIGNTYGGDQYTFNLPDYRARIVVGNGRINGEDSPSIGNVDPELGATGGAWLIDDTTFVSPEFVQIEEVKTSGWENVEAQVRMQLEGTWKVSVGPLDDTQISRVPEHSHQVLTSRINDSFVPYVMSVDLDEFAHCYEDQRVYVNDFVPSNGLLGHSHAIVKGLVSNRAFSTYGNFEGISDTTGSPSDKRLYRITRQPELTVASVSYNGSSKLVTVTFSDNHGLDIGDKILVRGMSPADANGEFEIAQSEDFSFDTLSYEYKGTGTVTATRSGANVEAVNYFTEKIRTLNPAFDVFIFNDTAGSWHQINNRGWYAHLRNTDSTSSWNASTFTRSNFVNPSTNIDRFETEDQEVIVKPIESFGTTFNVRVLPNSAPVPISGLRIDESSNITGVTFSPITDATVNYVELKVTRRSTAQSRAEITVQRWIAIRYEDTETSNPNVRRINFRDITSAAFSQDLRNGIRSKQYNHLTFYVRAVNPLGSIDEEDSTKTFYYNGKVHNLVRSNVMIDLNVRYERTNTVRLYWAFQQDYEGQVARWEYRVNDREWQRLPMSPDLRTTREHIVSGLADGQQYRFKVRVIPINGSPVESNEVTFRLPTGTGGNKLSNLRGLQVSNTQIRILWDAPSGSGILSYQYEEQQYTTNLRFTDNWRSTGRGSRTSFIVNPSTEQRTAYKVRGITSTGQTEESNLVIVDPSTVGSAGSSGKVLYNFYDDYGAASGPDTEIDKMLYFGNNTEAYFDTQPLTDIRKIRVLYGIEGKVYQNSLGGLYTIGGETGEIADRTNKQFDFELFIRDRGANTWEEQSLTEEVMFIEEDEDDEANQEDINPPAEVTGLTVTEGSTRAVLTWPGQIPPSASIAGFWDYRIESVPTGSSFSSSTSGYRITNWQRIPGSTYTTSTYTIDGLDTDRDYRFYIRLISYDGGDTRIPRFFREADVPRITVSPRYRLRWSSISGAENYRVDINGRQGVNVGRSTSYTYIPRNPGNYSFRIIANVVIPGRSSSRSVTQRTGASGRWTGSRDIRNGPRICFTHNRFYNVPRGATIIQYGIDNRRITITSNGPNTGHTSFVRVNPLPGWETTTSLRNQQCFTFNTDINGRSVIFSPSYNGLYAAQQISAFLNQNTNAWVVYNHTIFERGPSTRTTRTITPSVTSSNNLSWSFWGGLGITHYEIRWTGDDGSSSGWIRVNSSPYRRQNNQISTSWEHINTRSGVVYSYTLRPIFTGSVNFSSTNRDPSTRVTVTTGAAGGFILNWDDPQDPAISHYEYTYTDSDGGSIEWTRIPGSSAITTSHSVTGLDPDKTYTFNVRAINEDLATRIRDRIGDPYERFEWPRGGKFKNEPYTNKEFKIRLSTREDEKFKYGVFAILVDFDDVEVTESVYRKEQIPSNLSSGENVNDNGPDVCRYNFKPTDVSFFTSNGTIKMSRFNNIRIQPMIAPATNTDSFPTINKHKRIKYYIKAR